MIFAPSKVAPNPDTHRTNHPRTAQYLAIPNTYQPSRMAVFQELFTSHFIANFADPQAPKSRLNGWVLQLPEYLALSPNGAIEYAIRASTMAFYGKLVSDGSIQDAARQAYSVALHRQITETRSLTNSSQSQSRETGFFAASTICSAILLSMFETIMPNGNRAAWSQHLQGAAHLIQIQGPEACQKGLSNHLYRIVRHCAVRSSS